METRYPVLSYDVDYVRCRVKVRYTDRDDVISVEISLEEFHRRFDRTPLNMLYDAGPVGYLVYKAPPLPNEIQAPERPTPWPDPTPEQLDDPLFDAIWDCIKTWDINVPGAYTGYCGATGNHVRAIFDAITAVYLPKEVPNEG